MRVFITMVILLSGVYAQKDLDAAIEHHKMCSIKQHGHMYLEPMNQKAINSGDSVHNSVALHFEKEYKSVLLLVRAEKGLVVVSGKRQHFSDIKAGDDVNVSIDVRSLTPGLHYVRVSSYDGVSHQSLSTMLVPINVRGEVAQKSVHIVDDGMTVMHMSSMVER